MILQVDLFSFVFWRKSTTQKTHFEINWPLIQPLIQYFSVRWFSRHLSVAKCYQGLPATPIQKNLVLPQWPLPQQKTTKKWYMLVVMDRERPRAATVRKRRLKKLVKIPRQNQIPPILVPKNLKTTRSTKFRHQMAPLLIRQNCKGVVHQILSPIWNFESTNFL